jgi:hypothetical protein
MGFREARDTLPGESLPPFAERIIRPILPLVKINIS